MFPDIVIILLSLIAVFERKKWAIIAATICLIFYICASLFLVIGLPNDINPNLATEFSGPGAALPDKVFDDDFSIKNFIDSLTIIAFEISVFIIGWIRVISFNKKIVLSSQEETEISAE